MLGTALPEAGLWRSCVMSVSSEPDPEGRQGSVGVAAVEPERGGIDRSCSASTPMARLRTAAMTCGAGLPAGR
jgi:hypothetical protein